MSTTDMTRLPWRRARRSQTNGQCVEAAGVSNDVAIRDSKQATDRDFPHLAVPADNWAGFIAGIRSGELSG